MSASTVSLTANPAARRRPLVAGEKKSNLDTAAAEVVGISHSNGGLTGGNDGHDRIVDNRVTSGNVRDLSHHSLRGEAVLERNPKEAKKTANGGVVNSTISPRRSRKTLTKNEKPRWATVVSIFIKNLVLLIVLVGLVQLIRKLVVGSGEGVIMGLSDIEGRIAEVERFTKKTAHLIQMQVDVVDRQVKEEIGGLREEVEKKIEDQTGVLEGEVRKVQARNDELEQLIREMNAPELLSKSDLDEIIEQLKVIVGGYINLDDLRAYARDLVEKEIEKHAADGLGRVDYAVASGGGMVVKHSEPYVKGKGVNWFLKGGRNAVHGNAEKILKPSFGEPGQCFPLKGSSGFVQIRLRTAIIPEAITLEHVAESVAYDRSSAPKDCRVSGWLEGHGLDRMHDAEKRFLLAEFTYDLEKSHAQTFNVLELAGASIVDTVRLDFTSNHGSPSHTCIYRLRVHGSEPDSVSVVAMQS